MCKMIALDQFKLFVFDTGLLKHMAGVDNSAILLKSDYQFKGPLTENYCLQQLRGQFGIKPRYYADKNSEIDFVLQTRLSEGRVYHQYAAVSCAEDTGIAARYATYFMWKS